MKTASLPLLSLPAEAGRMDGNCIILADGLGVGKALRMRRMLEALQYTVTMVDSLELALSACRRGAALVVAPASEAGFRLLWLLRRAGYDIPCIAVLAEPSIESTLQALAAGAGECLTWPFDITLLAQRMRQMHMRTPCSESLLTDSTAV